MSVNWELVPRPAHWMSPWDCTNSWMLMQSSQGPICSGHVTITCSDSRLSLRFRGTERPLANVLLPFLLRVAVRQPSKTTSDTCEPRLNTASLRHLKGSWSVLVLSHYGSRQEHGCFIAIYFWEGLVIDFVVVCKPTPGGVVHPSKPRGWVLGG